MKNYKILFAAILLIFSVDQSFALPNVIPSEQQQVAESPVGLQNTEFPPYSTDQNIYAITSTEEPAEPEIVVTPVIISDKIVDNYFNTGKTRTLITQETRDGKMITTTETWKTKNPSYLTWKNGALLAIITVSILGPIFFVHYNFEKETKSYNENISKQVDSKHKHNQELESYQKTLSEECKLKLARWQDLFFAEDNLTSEEIDEMRDIEMIPEFKKALSLSMPNIDFSAQDDHSCDFCTRLREAYARTDERDHIPNYFD